VADAGSSNTSSIHTTIDIQSKSIGINYIPNDLHLHLKRIFQWLYATRSPSVPYLSIYPQRQVMTKKYLGTPINLAPNNSPTIFIEILTRPTFLSPYRPSRMRIFFFSSYDNTGVKTTQNHKQDLAISDKKKKEEPPRISQRNPRIRRQEKEITSFDDIKRKHMASAGHSRTRRMREREKSH